MPVTTHKSPELWPFYCHAYWIGLGAVFFGAWLDERLPALLLTYVGGFLVGMAFAIKATQPPERTS